MPDHINVREEEQQKVKNLIVLKTPEQEGEANVPEDPDLQNLQKEALCLTTSMSGRRSSRRSRT